MASAAALAFCVVLLGLAVFQVALALGVPLGHFAWGGQHRVLPNRLRLGSVIALPIYGAMAFTMLLRAGMVWPDQAWAGAGIWVVIAYLGLGLVMNAISRSPHERWTMTPLVLVLLLLALTVALA